MFIQNQLHQLINITMFALVQLAQKILGRQNAIIAGITGFIFTNSYLALYQLFTKRMAMKHHKFKRILANAMAPLKVYNLFFNIRNILTQVYYALIHSLFTHICSYYVIHHKFYFIFHDIDNVPLSLQSSMISKKCCSQHISIKN